jgi:glycosyltransferase involved in cell wall biosynthesis
MNHGPTITAAIITRNEEEKLPGCLARLHWVDEIIVVDSQSTDASVAIALAAGARVIERPFTNFAAQRNAALGAAQTDWVLFVDADERVTPQMEREVRSRLANCRKNAFRVPIRSSILGRRFRFSGTQDDRPLRLVRRGSGTFQGEVHEVFMARGSRGQLRAWLEHETMPDVPALLAKVNRYTTLAAEARIARGERAGTLAGIVAPAREVFRRLFWKQGWLDGPTGWLFCLLSGLSEWVLVDKQRRLTRVPRGERS